MGRSACKCNCMLLPTPSPSQHMEDTQASAIPGQGFPHRPSSSYLGRLILSNLRNFTWKHHHTLCSTHPHQRKAYNSVHPSHAKLPHHPPVGTFSTIPQVCFKQETQPLNTTAATLLLVPQQLETAHKHMPLSGKAALLTSSSLFTRVQTFPKN